MANAAEEQPLASRTHDNESLTRVSSLMDRVWPRNSAGMKPWTTLGSDGKEMVE